MKLQLFALLVVVAGACAMPKHSANDVVVVDSSNQALPRSIVESNIRRIIQEVSLAIKAAGLDPLVLENQHFVGAPVPFIVEFAVLVENLNFVGLSNIKIHSLDYNLILSRLRFDISLPEIKLEISNADILAYVFEDKIEGQFKGSLSIESIRVSGEVRVFLGITGVGLRSVSINFGIGNIKSNLSLSLHEKDYSESLNEFLNETIPETLEEKRDEINKRLEQLVTIFFDLLHRD